MLPGIYLYGSLLFWPNVFFSFAIFLTSYLFFQTINYRITVSTICKCVIQKFSGQCSFHRIRALCSNFHLQHKKERLCRKKNQAFPSWKTYIEHTVCNIPCTCPLSQINLSVSANLSWFIRFRFHEII